MEFEKNIPIPKRKGAAVLSKYAGMEIGDSLFFPGSRSSTGLLVYARSKGWKIVSRAMDGGFRYWRVK